MKSGKCSGLDLIPNEFIKVSADIFLPILVKLLKSSSDWQNARVMEPFIDYNKSGDPGNCSNYRGLSVTCCIGKLTNTGVKQGDNLSPTLFSIYINDLVQDINSLF